ncbi:MAG: hypothetical protein JWN72_1196 [Thermoleophilia bacterium]|nr:hypothetical protein [Thermoleophilia bacterium]
MMDLEETAREGRVTTLRASTSAGRTSTVRVARHPRASTTMRLAHLEPARPLLAWCRDHGVTEALSGGFFTKPAQVPLGYLHVDGSAVGYAPFREPWNLRRGAVHVDGAGIYIGSLAELQTRSGPVRGDELQAGPLLVQGGRTVVAEIDPEGFSSTNEEFDSDITIGPLPRTALGISREELFAVTVDGRSDEDDGMTLVELADLLVALGIEDALNLDGGSCSALISGGRMHNRPRNDRGELLADGYLATTAFTFQVDD